MLFFNKKTEKFFNSGFTLTELLVVISISTILITTMVINQDKWNDQLSLKTQTYEMALMIRQAQYFSLGVRGSSLVSGDQFDASYGVYVDMNIKNSEGRVVNYSFFIDKNKNNVLDSGELIESKTLGRGIYIEKICGYNNSLDLRCTPQDGIYKVGINWIRPDVSSVIKFFNSATNEQTSVIPPTVIYLKSSKGLSSEIEISSSGVVATD